MDDRSRLAYNRRREGQLDRLQQRTPSTCAFSLTVMMLVLMTACPEAGCGAVKLTADMTMYVCVSALPFVLPGRCSTCRTRQ